MLTLLSTVALLQSEPNEQMGTIFVSQLIKVQQSCQLEYRKYCDAGGNRSRPISVASNDDDVHCLVTSLTLGPGSYFSPRCGGALRAVRHTMAELPGNDVALMMKCQSVLNSGAHEATCAITDAGGKLTPAVLGASYVSRALLGQLHTPKPTSSPHLLTNGACTPQAVSSASA